MCRHNKLESTVKPRPIGVALPPHPSDTPAYRQLHWRSYQRTPLFATNSALRPWLLDRGSLTERLIRASKGQFEVRVLFQGMGVPHLSEQRALDLPARQRTLIREVILLGNHQAWVYARSIIPVKTLTGRLRRLRKLDNRPLGALLFSDPGMARGPIEISNLSMFEQTVPATCGHPIQGRRSLFWLDSKPLLVSEVFLTGFSPYNKIS